MADTMWFDRKPGDIASIGSEEDGDPTTLMIADPSAAPDWVRLPKEIGGARLKVIKAFQQACPMCKGGAREKMPVRHLECDQGYFVAECMTHGFAWYKRKGE